MNRVVKLQNSIQPYAWGSHRAIAELLGQPAPSANPQAELWMGAHPKASSKIWYQGRWQSLAEVIQEYPEEILGRQALTHFGAQLPFLLKILAAEQPLSIQAHPSKRQAREGFERENAQGIPLSAGHRNYKDDQHKPECICALTTFWGVCGFRPLAETHTLLKAVWPPQDRGNLDRLLSEDRNNTVRPFFERVMTLPSNERKTLLAQVISAAQQLSAHEKAYEWVLRLNNQYPDDIGVLSPILLNLICLQPGEALFLPAGQMHAYFDGLGIEIMANSDNVLRGGLTPKHVDITELLKILDFIPRPVNILNAQPVSNTERRYASAAEEFVLSIIDIAPEHAHQAGFGNRSAEILFCMDGTASVSWDEQQKHQELRKGQSVLIPAAVQHYTISGQATLYKAAVNLTDARQS